MSVVRAAILAVLALVASSGSLAAQAEQIGFLSPIDPETSRADTFLHALRDLGWIEGRNLVIEYRSARGRMERLPELAAELVRLKPNVIVAVATVSALAAKAATTTIPIVFTHVSDPIGVKLVPTLGRPGANVTGWTHVNVGLNPKRLELFKDVVPAASRIHALWHLGGLGEQTERDMLQETKLAAQALGIEIMLLPVRDAGQIDAAFAAATQSGFLLLLQSPLFLGESRRIVELAAKHRLPVMYFARDFTEAGGLMAYGANPDDMMRGAAHYVDKILRGARPGDLPVARPTRFEFAVNLRTARALGLKIPPSVLERADHVIE